MKSTDKKNLARERISPSDAFIIALLSAGTVVMLFPFFWMLVTSFDRSAVVSMPFPPRLYPLEPSLHPYKVAFTNVRLPLYIVNSLLIAAGTIVFSVSSALLSGYALSKIHFRGHKVALVIVLSVMMIPFESTMISKYLLVNSMGLLDTYWALFLPAIVYPFGTYLAKQFFDTLPDALREAARIDGAGETSIFLRVYMPLCGALTATLSILQFLESWNDLLWPLLTLNSVSKFNIQIGISTFMVEKINQPMPAIIMAITAISVVPILVVYLFLQRYIVEGIAMQGIKQ